MRTRLLFPILCLALGLGGTAVAMTYAAAKAFAHDLSHTLVLARSCGAARVPACTAGSTAGEVPMRAVDNGSSVSVAGVSGGGVLGEGVLGLLMMLLAIRWWGVTRPRMVSAAKGRAFLLIPDADAGQAERSERIAGIRGRELVCHFGGGPAGIGSDAPTRRPSSPAC